MKPSNYTSPNPKNTNQTTSKEGEAIALLNVASCRLLDANRLEALGAAQRARQLFRELRHRRGRLESLEIMAKAWQETLPALEVDGWERGGWVWVWG